MKMKKTTISLVLALIMVFSLVLVAAPAAEAAGHTTHCVCGGKLEGHTCANTTFQPLSQATFDAVTAESAPVKLHNDTVYSLEKGSYYLTENIAVAEQILIFEEIVVQRKEPQHGRTVGDHILRIRCDYISVFILYAACAFYKICMHQSYFIAREHAEIFLRWFFHEVFTVDI